MREDLMIKCLIAFILGWIIARMMGNGFQVGCQEIKLESDLLESLEPLEPLESLEPNEFYPEPNEFYPKPAEFNPEPAVFDKVEHLIHHMQIDTFINTKFFLLNAVKVLGKKACSIWVCK